MSSLEKYFETFRNNIVGNNVYFESPYGKKKIIYADWTASGRMYAPIEQRLLNDVMPYVANTHTETTVTGTAMTIAYHEAKHIIKKHVHAGSDDVLLFSGSGMTAAVNKLQRILGLRVPERITEYTVQYAQNGSAAKEFTSLRSLFDSYMQIDDDSRPVVFCTHMEHHSNQTTWIETIADVEIIRETSDGLVDLEHLKQLIEKYKHKRTMIAAVTGCSNVTGIQTPYHHIARLMHQNNGLCFVDFACSAPYISIDMHPEDDELGYLDAIYFSPHKFLGGPGTPGVLIFDSKLYKNRVPDHPGGGTVVYTNPWMEHDYIEDIEAREDGGTPPFLQGIKTAMAVKLKEEMGIENIIKREEEILSIIFSRMPTFPGVVILEGEHQHRLGVISFVIEGCHYNFAVKVLNDRFGVQTRGGCSCAGTYGHYLLQLNELDSRSVIRPELRKGNNIPRPGWIRMSIHPTMTNAEVQSILDAIEQVALHHKEWINDYEYDVNTNEFLYKGTLPTQQFDMVHSWFGNTFSTSGTSMLPQTAPKRGFWQSLLGRD
ncbi:MAG: aminotransferase class V-fold PLP-dependent enzyme [Bacteriodetes bacterium]|nr:aminotransferase class V-fold PLP-dependent enzyme [Bacteroidota bacterium]